MALNKRVPTPYGVAATYHRIESITHLITEGATHVRLAGYASQEARRAGREPLSAEVVTLSGDAFAPDATRADLYAAVKAASPTLIDAKDC